MNLVINLYRINNGLAAPGALAHHLQCRTAFKIQNGAPKWLTRSGKVSTPRFLLNKFFDPNTPSMRSGHNGGEKKQGKKGAKKESQKPTAVKYLRFSINMP